MDKFLFLDIDGVLNSHRSLFKTLAEYYGITYSDRDWSEKYWNSVDGTNPDLLSKIDKARKNKIKKFPNVSGYSFPFDNICIDYCNKIIEENDSDIVVISTWRLGRDLKELQELFDGVGLKGKVIGKTGYGDTRGLEIYDWIEKYQNKYDKEINSICILDDDHSFDIDYMFGEYTAKDISSLRTGLRKTHIKQSKEIFNKLFYLKNIIKQ